MRYTIACWNAAHACRLQLHDIAPMRLEGRVIGLSGLVVDIDGLGGHVSVGDRLMLAARDGAGDPGGDRRLSPGLGAGDAVRRARRARARQRGAVPRRAEWHFGAGAGFRFGGGATLAVADAWLGRVLDPLGRPLDGRGPLPAGSARSRACGRPPPDATQRARLGPRLDLGVRALNCFTTCRQGQRLGLFSGSGIGKSTLLAMLARHTACDVAVLALVGERGREVREFLEDDLGETGLARSVVVVATSDSPPLMRRQAAFCGDDGGRAFPRPGEVRAAADGQRHAVLPGTARDRPVGRRAAGDPRLSAERVRRIAAPAGACRAGAGTAGWRRRSHHRRCSPCWSRATTTTSRSPMRCAASWTGTSCWTAGSPRAAAIRRWTCCGRCRAPCRAATRRRRMP